MKRALLLQSKAEVFIEVDMQPTHGSSGTTVKVSLQAYSMSDNKLIVRKSGENKPSFGDDYAKLSEVALLSKDGEGLSSTMIEEFIKQVVVYLNAHTSGATDDSDED